MNGAERTGWFLFGLCVTALGVVVWCTHRQIVAAVNAGARMVGRCRKCAREYTFSHPSQSRVAREYHESYDCVRENDEDQRNG